MTCLSGAVEETQYAVPPAEEDPELLTPRSPAKRPLAVPGVIASLAPCPPLRRGRTARLQPGQTAYISDEIVRRATPFACFCLQAVLLCRSYRAYRRVLMRYIVLDMAGITRGGLRGRLRRRRDAAFVRAAHQAREAVRVGREPRDAAASRLLLRRRRAAGWRRGGRRGGRALATSDAAHRAAPSCCVTLPHFTHALSELLTSRTVDNRLGSVVELYAAHQALRRWSGLAAALTWHRSRRRSSRARAAACCRLRVARLPRARGRHDALHAHQHSLG